MIWELLNSRLKLSQVTCRKLSRQTRDYITGLMLPHKMCHPYCVPTIIWGFVNCPHLHLHDEFKRVNGWGRPFLQTKTITQKKFGKSLSEWWPPSATSTISDTVFNRFRWPQGLWVYAHVDAKKNKNKKRKRETWISQKLHIYKVVLYFVCLFVKHWAFSLLFPVALKMTEWWPRTSTS